MKSRRSWLMGLALGAALFFGTPNAKAGGPPVAFTYQGAIWEGNAPAPDGTYAIVITLTDPNGTVFTETFNNATVKDGIFNLVIGDPNNGTPFPNNFSFNGQVTITSITVNGTPIPLSDPFNKVWSAPYAINAGTVNGLSASPVPVAGDLFPVPIGTGYTGSAKIDPAFLPTGIPNTLLATQDITTINNVPPASGGNFNITGSGGVTVTPTTNGINISAGGGGVTSVTGVAPIQVSPTNGNVIVSLIPGSLTAADFGPGAITGNKINGIAGQGLSQDANGFLDVNVDNQTIGITSIPNGNFLEVLPGGIGTLQLANGAVTNAKIATPYMTFTSSAGTLLPPGQVFLGGTGNYDLNLGHTNTWTIVQNFRNMTDTGTFTNAGAFNETGASTLVGSLNQSAGNVNLLSAGTVGNTFTVGIPGGTNLTTLNGPLTQLGGVASLNAGSNFATNINTGNSTGNVTIGNNTALQTNSVSILAGGAGNVTVSGTTNINTTSAAGNTSIGNTGNNVTVNGATNTINGTTNNINGATNVTGATTIVGVTTINNNANNNTSINTGSSTGTVAIGNAASTTNMLGVTNINTNPSASATNIGGPSSTTTVNGPTNINTTGASTTTIGSLGNNALVVNSTTTHNGTTAFNNNVTQTAGTAQFLNTQVNGTLGSTGATTLATGANLTNSFGTGTAAQNTIGNATGTNTINGLNNISGLTTYGTLGPDGNRVVINGAVSTPPVQSNQWELIVNGDAQVTGSFNAGTITATTLGAPTGMFDNLTTFTPANTVINVLKGINQTVATTNTFTGPVSANGGITSSTGTVAITGNETVSGNTNLAGTLNVVGNTTLTNLTTSGSITDNSNNFTLGLPGAGQDIGTLTVRQNASPNAPPYTWILPDSSGTIALLQNIAAIAQGTAPGQTLWWTGNVAVPNNTWQPTSNLLNRPDLNTVTIASGQTFNSQGNTNNFGSTNNFSGTSNFTGALVNITTTSVNIGSGTVTSTDPINEGIAGTDQTWLTTSGLPTAWAGAGTLPTQPFAINLFESRVVGDEEVTGTLYTSTLLSGITWTPQLRFDVAGPYTAGGTMDFSGTANGTAGGTPVVTINNIPAGSYGELVSASATAAGGIKVTGAGAGVGVNVDPFPTGINVSATTTGEVIGGGANTNPTTGLTVVAGTTGATLNMAAANTGTGLTIGTTTTPATGETIVAGTTGLNVTAPTSINALGTANINVTGGATTNIATTNTATTNIGVTGGTNNVLGTTNVNTSGASGTNIGNGSSTTTIVGPTNVNITGTSLMTVGNAGTDQIWEQINGVNTGGFGPPPAIPGILSSQYELTDNGDMRVAGAMDAGAVFTLLMAAPNIRFDRAQPYTAGGTMTFDGAGPQGAAAGTNVVTINNIPAGGSYGLQVNGPTAATTGGGIQITGNGFGTGLNIDPFPTGMNVLSATGGTGAIFNSQTANTGTGVTIGTGTTYATGETIVAGTTGLNVTAPTALNATGTTNINTSGAAGTNIGNAASTTTVLGPTNINVTGGATTNIATTNTATTNIGVTGGTNNVLGTTNVNTSGGSGTNIGNAASTTTVLGPTNINNTGGATTNIAAGAAATTNIGITGGTNNILGVTSINTSGASGTTIGNTGSTTTVNGPTNINQNVNSATNINTGTSTGAVAIGTGTGTNALGNTTGSTTILGNPLNENVGVGLTTNIGTGAGTGGSINIGNTTSTTTITGTLNANGQTTITSNNSPIFTVQTAGGAVGTGIQVQLNGGTITTGENITATTTGISLNGAPTSVQATGAINSTGTTSTSGSTFALNNGALTTLTLNNAANSTTAPALAVSGAASTTGNTTLGTNSGTTNSLGNAGASTNNIGNGAGAANNIGNGGGATINVIGSTASSNQIGTNATTNFLGLNAGTNNIGNSSAAGTVANNIGLASAGSTANNTIGTAAVGSTAANVIGSVTGAVTNTLNGLTTANPPTTGTASTNTVTITASPDAAGTWALKASSALTDANNSQGIFGTATSAAAGPNAANAGRFDASGTGTTNTALALNSSGASTVSNVGANVTVSGTSPNNRGVVISSTGSATANIGADITAAGTGSIGLRINSTPGAAGVGGPVTGISIDASNSNNITGNGMIISGIQNNSNGENLNFAPNGIAGVGNANGINIDMTNAKLGNVNGIRILNNADATSDAINISTSNGTGVNVAMTSAGTGVTIGGVGSASGETVTGVTSGVGIQVATPTGGGTGEKLVGDGSTTNTALEVNNGNVRATGANPFSGTVAYTGVSPVTVTNSLVKATSMIMVTYTMSGVGNNVSYVTSVENQTAGSFQVNCSSPNAGTISYIIINP